ncbi:GerAB/ArcD/ProY family transporter [Clostridium aciditolerans]|uniref:Endospore germination permease n=1 Tax=Clostridium aciditolerans TaxID=339861 RepID=A0A934HWC6_9CLOT|nr:GerAB/ArcD/ProY family transporter [Clostridium aciditolerans]MBI6872152.1 endospore germination permease [Clostridium aciditolerans]
MDKDTDSLISPSQLTLILVGSMLGIGILNLANDVVKYAKQDGWISCILGAAYPLYMTFIANYMCKKFPKYNILKLSKKFLGKFLGTISNITFLSYFILLITEIASGISNVLKVYMVSFLKNNQLLLVAFLAPAFIAYKGIKTLRRVNELIFYLSILMFFIPIAVLKSGSFLNVMPVFSSGLINIVKASKETAFAYSGIEILFLIYPYLQSSKDLKKSTLKSILITMTIYTWVVFSVIYYLGADIVPKFTWSTVVMSEAIVIPVINNFRYIFMVLWSLIMLKTMSNDYYAVAYGMSQLTSIAKRKTFVYLIFPLLFYISSKYGDPNTRANFLSKTLPVYLIFNLAYVSIISLVLYIKKGDKNEQKA